MQGAGSRSAVQPIPKRRGGTAVSRFVRLTAVPSTRSLRAMVGAGANISGIGRRPAARAATRLARGVAASVPWFAIACSASPPPTPCLATVPTSRPYASFDITKSPQEQIGWISAAPRNYERAPWRLEGAACLVETDRCPFEPQHVPRCPDGVRPGEDLERHDGEIVVVAGRLRIGYVGFTHKACGLSVENQCCNQHTSPIVLETADSRRIALRDDRLELVECKGDKTRLCCPVDTVGRRVFARGRLKVIEKDTATEATFLMDGAEICRDADWPGSTTQGTEGRIR